MRRGRGESHDRLQLMMIQNIKFMILLIFSERFIKMNVFIYKKVDYSFNNSTTHLRINLIQFNLL